MAALAALSSIQVAEWPCFGKELLFRLTKCFLCKMTFFPKLVSGTGFWFGLYSILIIAYIRSIHMINNITSDRFI